MEINNDIYDIINNFILKKFKNIKLHREHYTQYFHPIKEDIRTYCKPLNINHKNTWKVIWITI